MSQSSFMHTRGSEIFCIKSNNSIEFNSFVLERKSSTDGEQLKETALTQKLLTEHKDIVNQDFQKFLVRLKQIQIPTQTILSLIGFVQDFLTIPCQGFTIRRFSLIIKELQKLTQHFIANDRSKISR